MIRIIASLLAFGLISVSATGWAESKRPMSSERSSINSIFDLIDNVNLSTSEVKSRQSLQDMLDMKSQLYKATRTSVPSESRTRQAPPSPLRKSF